MVAPAKWATLIAVKDKRILIVEDHSSVRALLRVMLEGEGYRCLEAGDGFEALEAARSQRPDLMLLDLMMPELDGEKVILQAQGSADISTIPILVVTAREEGIERITDAVGAANVFMKPFDESKLIGRVRELIGPGEGRSTSPWRGS